MNIEILLTEDAKHGFRHVTMKADGGEGEQQHVVPIIELLTKALKEGKRALVRHVPSLVYAAEYDTGTAHWTAASRFTVILEETVV